MIVNTFFLAKGDDFLGAFIIKMLVFLIRGNRLVVVRPTKNYFVRKADDFKNLSEALVYQVRRRIRLYAYPCFTTSIMERI